VGLSVKKYDSFEYQVMNNNAKGRIWHGLFMVVLRRPFRAPKAHVLFAGVCLYLCLVVGVAVVVAVVALFFYSVLIGQWQAMRIQHFTIARAFLKGYVKIGAWN